MSKPNPTVLFGFFVAVIVAMCGVSLLKSGLYLGKHEGDTYHLLQIVSRMADGQWPHLDFMTPIGALAFAPIVLFLKFGFGAGTSIILGQVLVSIALLPAVWWAAYSRLQGKLPYVFGLFVLVLVLALVHGEAQRSVSISMHYNRWAWAIAFIVILLAVIPSKLDSRPTVDGVIVGLGLSALLMIKVTYFAAFALPVAIGLLLHKSYRTLFIGILAGLAVLLVISSMAGFGYWQAYLADLLTVSQGDVRPNPGEPFGAILGAPAYLGASLALISGVILLRQSREMAGGLLLLLLTPGFFFVTYQNFANDPQWLMLLGVLLLAFIPVTEIRNSFGWDMATALKLNAAIALALTAPSFFNLAYSPLRHFNLLEKDYTLMMPRSSVHTDLYTAVIRTNRVDARIAYDRPGSGLEAYTEISGRSEAGTLNGETLDWCTVELGLPAWFDTIAVDLEEAGLATGNRFFLTDLLSNLWLFGSSEPLIKGAPWYYGGLPGLASADYVLVPTCPVVLDVRLKSLEALDESGVTLTEVRRTPLYILLEPKFN